MKNISKPIVGVGLIVIKEDKVLLGKRKGTHGSECYSTPGGKLEYRETVEDCAIRELGEETGLKPIFLQLGPWTQDVIDGQHYISLFVIITEFEGEPKLLEPEKCEGWDWYAWDDLPSPLFLPLISFMKSMNMNSYQGAL